MRQATGAHPKRNCASALLFSVNTLRFSRESGRRTIVQNLRPRRINVKRKDATPIAPDPGCTDVKQKLGGWCNETIGRIAFLIIAFAMTPHNSIAAAPSEVIISHASMSTTSIPLWVTQRQNFFGKYGIKSKIVWVRGNPAQIATLVSGDTQIAYGGAPTAIAATLGGRDMKIIASLSSRESLDIVARPGIKSAKELAGKRFGVQSVGGGAWKTATVWLEYLGMDEKRDNIQMIVIGDVTVLAQSLEAGLIDATVVPGYLSRRLASKGFTVLGRCEETRLPSVGMTVLVERPYLQQNADTLQGVMMAHNPLISS